MRIIIANDIHGITAEVATLLAPLGVSQMLSPWPDDVCPPQDEHTAVTMFLQGGGIPAYAKRIADAVAKEPAILIGFSVGATSLWHYVATSDCHPEGKAILYYGSRIRNALELVPRCKTKLIFAEHEASFDPASLLTSLDDTMTTCEILSGASHGFMNPLHARFDADLAASQIACLKKTYL